MADAQDDIIQQEEKGADTTIVLMLGLYLILLAFFILMNVISEDSSAKRDIVVDSVRKGFDFRDPGNNMGSDAAKITAIPKYETTLAELEAVFMSYLEGYDYKIEKNDKRMVVSMDPQRFFEPNAAQLYPEMILFFEDLAAHLASEQEGIAIVSQVLVRHIQARTDAGNMQMAGDRAIMFTRALVEEGVPPTAVHAAAAKGPNRIILTFNLYPKGSMTPLEASQNLQREDVEANTAE